jgi:hypothetical protein
MTTSNGTADVVDKSKLDPLPTRLLPILHEYPTERVGSSGSITLALHTRTSSLYTTVRFKEGPESTGSVFSTITLAEDVLISPSESVAVAVHVTMLPTSVSDAETVYDDELPTTTDPTDQLYVTGTTPSSMSLAAAEHERIVPVYTGEEGEMAALLEKVGAEFNISILSSA